MGILDKVKTLIGKHEPQIDEAIDKAADFADDKTDSKHTDTIAKAADKAHEVVDELAGKDPGSPGTGTTSAPQ